MSSRLLARLSVRFEEKILGEIERRGRKKEELEARINRNPERSNLGADAHASPKHVKPLKSLRRRIEYFPISVRSIYTDVHGGTGRIPNHVYQTWTRPVLPFLLALEVKRFRRMNPEYSSSFFDDRRAAEYMESDYTGHPSLSVFKSVRPPVMKADIWRYCVLYREGGTYCDTKSAMTVGEPLNGRHRLYAGSLDVDAEDQQASTSMRDELSRQREMVASCHVLQAIAPSHHHEKPAHSRLKAMVTNAAIRRWPLLYSKPRIGSN